MPSGQLPDLQSIADFSRRQIQAAAQRYTPGVDPAAPNLEIQSLITMIGSLACGSEAKARLDDFSERLANAWGHADSCCNDRALIRDKIDRLKTFAQDITRRLRAVDRSVIDEWTASIGNIESVLSKERQRWGEEEKKLSSQRAASKEAKPTASTGSHTTDQVRSNIELIQRCMRVLEAEREFYTSPAGNALTEPRILLRGEWGTGKTHFLCDVTKHRLDSSRPTLLVLAKSFQGHTDILSAISNDIESGLTPEALIDQLDQAGLESGERGLVIIDGVNEGRRKEWRSAVTRLLSLVRATKNVGLLVSCRTPFEEVAISSPDLPLLHAITHTGFAEQEFDAQAEFFSYYKLPLPEVPLLDSEFSRPLTLKLICQSLQHLTGRKLALGFSGIASGQKGMTFILESFVNQVGAEIEREFGLPPKACWAVLKGDRRVADKKHSGFAPHMASTLREYVPRRSASKILRAHFPKLTVTRLRELLDAIRTNGLLDEDIVWHRKRGKSLHQIVLRLPYQRFSDHLVARHLLDTYLDKRSVNTVRKSFARGSALRRIFRAGRFQRNYAYPGWAQALITEFPESVKRVAPDSERELIFFLPRAAQHAHLYFEPFVEGLFWRDRAAFSAGTGRVVDWYVEMDHDDWWRKLIDALVAVSTKPRHPYHARRLYRYLSRFSMSDRDLKWSEYLRHGYWSPSVRRLLAWAERLDTVLVAISEDAAKELIVLLSLVLTTVVRKDRDLATKALVLIGEQHPRLLFEHALSSLSFNDPYVSERTLAAAYGVTMSRVDERQPVTFENDLSWLAKQLHIAMFATGALHATPHALRRDYALGVIKLALRKNPALISKEATAALVAPSLHHQSPFPPAAEITDAMCVDGKSAIQMDFGNYTIGGLIDHRANYDDKHPVYVDVRRQIEWRIGDLGYKEDRFDDIDRDIARHAFYEERRGGDKTDRYGKKYSWIAYFEMYGLSEDRKTLPDWRTGGRAPDCDIDPSFPKPPPPTTLALPPLFDGEYSTLAAWLRDGPNPNFDALLKLDEVDRRPGRWVLLDGWVDCRDQTTGFQVFTFLRGLFLRRGDVARVRDRYLAIEYPGNDQVPRMGEDHYVFAGEIGRSSYFAPGLLRKDGSGVHHRQTDSTFEEHRWIPDPIASDTGGETKDAAADASADGEKDPDDWSMLIKIPTGRSERIPGFRVEIPVRMFSWETHHSSLNQFTGFRVPAPALIERLGLHTEHREVNFYDSAGELATLYQEGHASARSREVYLLYIREDLLRKYLRETRQTMVWCNWGERNFVRPDFGFGSRLPEDVAKVMGQHQHIHRRFVTYDEVKGNRTRPPESGAK